MYNKEILKQFTPLQIRLWVRFINADPGVDRLKLLVIYQVANPYLVRLILRNCAETQLFYIGLKLIGQKLKRNPGSVWDGKFIHTRTKKDYREIFKPLIK